SRSPIQHEQHAPAEPGEPWQPPSSHLKPPWMATSAYYFPVDGVLLHFFGENCRCLNIITHRRSYHSRSSSLCSPYAISALPSEAAVLPQQTTNARPSRYQTWPAGRSQEESECRAPCCSRRLQHPAQSIRKFPERDGSLAAVA